MPLWSYRMSSPTSFADGLDPRIIILFSQVAKFVTIWKSAIITVLIGDNGYACKRYFLTPVLNATNTPERRFNKAQIRTRKIIERAFGSSVFDVWNTVIYGLKLENSLTTIVATACLHNIAKRRSLPLPDDTENPDPEESEVVPSFVPDTNAVGASTR